MKKYLVGVILLLIGCQTDVVKPPEKPEWPATPVIVEEPKVTPDCSPYDRNTGNSAIDEWLKKELDKCLGLTN